MNPLPRLVSTIADLIDYLLWLYVIVLIARVIVSWVNADPYNPIVRFLHQVTEPVLRPVRRRLPDLGGLDISPALVIVAIQFLKPFLVGWLYDIAASLR